MQGEILSWSLMGVNETSVSHSLLKHLSAAAIGLSCQVQNLPSFQAPRACCVLKLLQIQSALSSFPACFIKKMCNKIISEFGFRMIL